MLVDVIRVLQIYYTDSTAHEGYLSVNENVMNTESYDTQTPNHNLFETKSSKQNSCAYLIEYAFMIGLY